jgi:hypothetical protein
MARRRGGVAEASPTAGQPPAPKLALCVAVFVVLLLFVAHERESPMSDAPASPARFIPAEQNVPALPGAPIISADESATNEGGLP